MSLLPAWRGNGYAGEVVRLLCRYGFQIPRLHRLQLETLSDNAAMIHTALSAGFTREGVLRSNAWVDGRFVRSYFRPAWRRVVLRLSGGPGTRHRCRANSSRIAGGTGR